MSPQYLNQCAGRIYRVDSVIHFGFKDRFISRDGRQTGATASLIAATLGTHGRSALPQEGVEHGSRGVIVRRH